MPEPFATLDAAVAGLYPAADRQRRARIRAMAEVVAAFGPRLISPETLSMRRLERLAAAARGGFSALIDGALPQSKATTAAAQWEMLENVLREAEAEARAPRPPTPAPAAPAASSGRARTSASAAN